MLLSRYGNIEYIINMPWIQGIDSINKAYENEDKDRYWQMWLMKFQGMDKDNYVSFADYYKACKTPQKVSEKPKEEIIEKVKKIRKSLRK